MKLAKGSASFYTYGLIILVVFLLNSCATPKRYSGFTTVRKYQKNIPFIFKNNIYLNAESASKNEKTVMNLRLTGQIEDSAKVRIKDALFFFHRIKQPQSFDTSHTIHSASNMVAYMKNMGYYSSDVKVTYDTVARNAGEQQRIVVNYHVISGRRTMIDTLAYLFNQPELEQIAVSTKKASELRKGSPVTKTKILDETNRLVDQFRNFGYYKFTADDIRVTGDTTIEALTTVTDDPFEQFRLLAEAAERRNNPTIRLGYQLENPDVADTLKKYFVNNIYILPDYNPALAVTDPSLQTLALPNYSLRFNQRKFRPSLFRHNIYFKKGNVFRQNDYFKTLNDLNKLGVWESPTIDIIENPDTNTLDLVVKLIPLKRYAFQGNIELSYSANSNTSNLPGVATGNLFGVSTNISVTDRNFAGSAIRMTNSVKLGAEFNTNRAGGAGKLINSREISFNNSFIFPKFSLPLRALNRQAWVVNQTFLNTNVSFINRVDFFKQQVVNTSYGFNFSRMQNRLWSLKLINFDFRRLFDRSPAFDKTLEDFPYLRYSFNTALVMGEALTYSSAKPAFYNPNVINRLTVNVEESGLLWGFLKEKNKPAGTGNFFNKYLREFVKLSGEYVSTVNFPKSALALRGFLGIGVPVGKSDTTLPFFKQFFGGGPNSMRGWPVQGIGVGGQSLAPYADRSTRFNNRTGDIQIEGNIEYRFDVMPLFSNDVLLKMALFTDIGNIWNFKNTRIDHSPDTTQFHFQNLYKQLGMSSGMGFRFDFGYFLIRLDMALRFKRPDLWTKNAGWQFPDISFRHLFNSAVNDRLWRYQHFNATIGIDYPF